MMDFYYKKDSELVLIHHGIAGQKWGKRNGPPYPLKYEAHSDAEKKGDYRFEPNGSKKNKPLKQMSGNKREDYKRVKNAYDEAKYATAASKLIAKEYEKANNKVEKRQSESNELKKKELRALMKASQEDAIKKSKELVNAGNEFSSLYGSKKIKDLTLDSLSDMNDHKAKNMF